MPALGRLSERDATAAMVSINRAAERGPFILVFGFAAAAATGLAVTAAPRGAVTDLVIAGASLASTIVTLGVNVPLNRRLEREGAAFWAVYRRRWTTSNTVRAALATTAVLVAGTHWAGTK
ncbi:anthrone oxygenase family protein [Pseudarthrobacter sp. NPDC058329]|uniref:anthrone oxygenase family protein n=1 Tax=Pseudarthrobacter sp. NPDC058329 TaxID=3346448 RepID=UPI0036D90E49